MEFGVGRRFAWVFGFRGWVLDDLGFLVKGRRRGFGVWGGFFIYQENILTSKVRFSVTHHIIIIRLLYNMLIWVIIIING